MYNSNKKTYVVSLSGILAHTVASVNTFSSLHDLTFRTETSLLGLTSSLRISTGGCWFGSSIHEGGTLRTTGGTLGVLVFERPASCVEVLRLAGGGVGVENGTGAVQVSETLTDLLYSCFHCFSGVQYFSALSQHSD